jgi:hypothetical protein
MTVRSNNRAWLRERLPRGATVAVHVSWEPHDPHYVYVYLPATEGDPRVDITERTANVAGLAFDGYTRAIAVHSARDGSPLPYVLGALSRALYGTPRALTGREIRG